MESHSAIGIPWNSFRKVLKVILGLVFIFSAILKIVDLDPFEIYVYSYHFFSFNFSLIVARLAIILELVLGIGLVSNYFHKLFWWGSIMMLLGYTGLIIYAIVLGRTDNCHCFGDLLQLDPLRSLLKNLVLLLLFLFLYPLEGKRFRGQWPALFGVVLLCTVAVFAVSPPDTFTHDSDPERVLQRPLFEEAMHEDPLASYGLDQGKKVVGFFSSSCDYCRLAARKISLMQRFYGFPEQDVLYVFMGTEEGVRSFFAESESTEYPYFIYDNPMALLKLADGKFPLIVMLQDGTVVHEYGLRNMDEEEIKLFFQK